MRRVRTILFSIILGAGTLAVIRGIGSLPFSRGRDTIVDTLLLPGGLLASVFYPFGVHGDSPTSWAWLSLLGNLAFYAAFWMFVLLIRAKWKRQQLPGAN
jgi:hypothetical protein